MAERTLQELTKRLDYEKILLGPHRTFISRPFEEDLHLDSDKPEKSRPLYGEMRTANPKMKNVVN